MSAGASSSTSGMLLFMERSHPAVLETIRRIVSGENSVAYAAVRDFDSNEYTVHVTEEGDAIVVGMRHIVPKEWFDANCKAELAGLLASHFGGALEKDLEEGTIAAVRVELPEDDKESIVKNPLLAKAASMRTMCLAAPFLKCVALYNANKLDFKLRIPYRFDENMYLFAAKNNFCVVITMRIPDKSDRQLARTFLTEFAEAKRLDKAAMSGPGFTFLAGESPIFPEGLKPVESPSDENVFWCMFSLSKKSMETSANTQLTVEFLANFRQYVMYHMQCARSSMHAKMRERVKTSLQVLARAKTSTTGRPRITIQ